MDDDAGTARGLRQALPEIQVELVASNAVSNLLRREADIALRMLRPEQSTLVARKIGDVQMGIFGHRNYLARRVTPRRAEDLLTHELIGNDSDDLMAQWHAVRAGFELGFLGLYQAHAEPDLLRRATQPENCAAADVVGRTPGNPHESTHPLK